MPLSRLFGLQIAVGTRGRAQRLSGDNRVNGAGYNRSLITETAGAMDEALVLGEDAVLVWRELLVVVSPSEMPRRWPSPSEMLWQCPSQLEMLSACE